jgi:single-strand DNA-binding protein
MFQRVTIIGNLGSDPETRFTQSGANVCSFSVATNRRWTNSDGSQGEETIWWRVSAWSKLGEICQQYLTKGRQVFIEGEMTPDRESGGPRIWTDQSGQPRASFEIRANTMKMLGGRDEGANFDSGYNQNNNARQAPQQQQRPAPAQQRPQAQSGARRSTMSAPPAADDFDDEYNPDEIPF